MIIIFHVLYIMLYQLPTYFVQWSKICANLFAFIISPVQLYTVVYKVYRVLCTVVYRVESRRACSVSRTYLT